MSSRGQGLNDRFADSHDDSFGVDRSSLSGTSQYSTEEFNSTGFILNWLRHDQDDYFQLITQFSHRRKLGTVANLHIHYMPGVNTGGDVYFYYQYAWVSIGQAIPEIGSWASGNATIVVPAGAIWTHQVDNIAANMAAPSPDSHSSILLLKLTRLGSNPLDTFSANRTDPGATNAANFGILGVDCHFTTDRIGSNGEYSD